jgi:hypothetical protein
MAPPAKKAGEGGEKPWTTGNIMEFYKLVMQCCVKLIWLEDQTYPKWKQERDRHGVSDCIAVSVLKATDTPASKTLEWWCFLTLDIQRSLWGDTN